ncbi:MAG: T9SS type A sorting domain-containing protein [candidate division Zixibacteria bacterium]
MSTRIYILGYYDMKKLIFICLIFLLTIMLLCNSQTFSAAVTDNAAIVSWTAPGDDGQFGYAAQYDIRYSTVPITEANWDSATQVQNEPTPSVANTTESFAITGLASGVQYYIAIKAADEVPNWSGLSNVLTITTATVDTLAPDPVADLQVETGSYGELILSWTAPGDDWNLGLANRYIIAYSTDTLTAENWQSADLWDTPPNPVQSGNQQTVTLTGLIEAQEYWVAVVSIDESNNESEISNVTHGEAGFDFVQNDDDGLPTRFELSQNYPNPFNPYTRFDYTIPIESHVTIAVYNILGQQTAVLVDEYQNEGVYTAEWDGRDKNGNQASSGVYFYNIFTEDYSESKKMVLLK